MHYSRSGRNIGPDGTKMNSTSLSETDEPNGSNDGLFQRMNIQQGATRA
ncbi:hypothetical protein [Paenibacillus sp. FSL E2-0151]